MKHLNSNDLKSLEYGEKVYRWDKNNFKGLRFVAVMPTSKNYLIFCDGEYLTHLYISKEGEFSNEWYSGEYDSKFVGELYMENLESRIETIKKVYFKEDE
jgi:hypothetical protein